MAKKIIRTGTTADPTGDSLKNAFVKVNDNFTELYNALGLDADTLNIGAFEFTGSTMTTTDSTAIVIDQATTITSNLSVGGDIVPQTALGGDLGSSTLPWRSLYVSNNTIYIGGTAVGLDANGNLTTGGTVVGSTPAWNSITGKPTFATVATTGAYADLTGKPTIPTLVSQLSNDSGFLTSVSNIQSESDVSIQVNLTDSTTRIWQFGEDGDLTFPDGTAQTTAYTGGGGGSGSTLVNGAYTVSLGSDGSLTLPGDIRSDGNINIDINLSDSTLRRWQFGEDGNLTLGGIVFNGSTTTNISGSNIDGTYQVFYSAGEHWFQGPINRGNFVWVDVLADLDGVGTAGHIRSGQGQNLIIDGGYENPSGAGGNLYLRGRQIEIRANVSGAGIQSKNWIFTDDGALTIPGDIRSEGNINIDINLSDSTLRRWSFGEDGELALPAGAVVKTTSGNLTIKGQEYVYIDSATNGQINIGTSSGIGAVVLGSKSRGTNVIVGDLQVENGVYEFFSSLADATGVVTHNCANGHIFYHTSPDANWTVNLTNLLDTWFRATSVTLIIAQGATGYYPSAVQIAGVAQTIKWQGNVTPTPSINRTDVVTFSIINVSGTYTVLGQLTGF